MNGFTSLYNRLILRTQIDRFYVVRIYKKRLHDCSQWIFVFIFIISVWCAVVMFRVIVGCNEYTIMLYVDVVRRWNWNPCSGKATNCNRKMPVQTISPRSGCGCVFSVRLLADGPSCCRVFAIILSAHIAAAAAKSVTTSTSRQLNSKWNYCNELRQQQQPQRLFMFI